MLLIVYVVSVGVMVEQKNAKLSCRIWLGRLRLNRLAKTCCMEVSSLLMLIYERALYHSAFQHGAELLLVTAD